MPHSGPLRGNVVVLGHHTFADMDPGKVEEARQTWLAGLFN